MPHCFENHIAHFGGVRGCRVRVFYRTRNPVCAACALCLLGSVNLTKFVLDPFGEHARFDWDEFRRVVKVFSRMLDNVVEINGLPLPRQRWVAGEVALDSGGQRVHQLAPVVAVAQQLFFFGVGDEGGLDQDAGDVRCLEHCNNIEDDCDGRSREKLRRVILDLQDTLTSIERCRKPVLAAVHGACIGGGIDLITACDMRYCSADAWFAVREIDVGMTADVGTLQRLPRARKA